MIVSVRLSLASPLAFDQGRIDLKAAWRMTRGRFWALFGSFLLAWSMMIVLGLAFLVGYSALAFVASGGAAGLKGLFSPDMSSLSAYFTPLTVLYMVASSLLYGLGFAVLVGVGVDAYRQLAGRGSPTGPVVERTDRSTHFGLHV